MPTIAPVFPAAPATGAAPPAPVCRPEPVPRVAVVLLNLGGPDSPAAVRPFLRNLFTDPAILRVPGFIRGPLGRLIADLRVKAASENYAILGGKSPLLELTREQAAALETALAHPPSAVPGAGPGTSAANTADAPADPAPAMDARCFVAMRYWHPFAHETVREVAAWGADEVVLLPLYPQFSTTTTGSSFDDWHAAAADEGLDLPTAALCCFHSDDGFAAATARIVRAGWEKARAETPADVPLRLLFSAHGLPESIVKRGDPYRWQVEQTVDAVRAHLDLPELDWIVCFQSRATPQKWIGPSTDDEIGRAGREKVAVLVCPIAFVSEHSETLVELDVEYRELAHEKGVPAYHRVPTQNADSGFIASLAALVHRARDSGRSLCSWAGPRQCPRQHVDCPHARHGAAGAPAKALAGATVAAKRAA